MRAYPCPACGGLADLTNGCPECHRPPDPEAAEVIELDGTIAELNRQVTQARHAYEELVNRLNAAVHQRNALALRVQARAGSPAPAQPTVPTSAPDPVPARPESSGRPARPESSGRAVQNLLFVLGGLLLGSAAIVFTAVAWASFGVPGRALILAVATLLILAVPPLAQPRRLTGTAETFAALGLLLVLLDGYAAWAVDLLGVTGLVSPERYTGLVCAGTAVLALGYGRAARLTGPGFVAVALAQPVPPLLLSGTGLGPAGWSAVFSVLALVDIAVVRWVSRPAALRIGGGLLAGLAALTASGLAAQALLGPQVAGAARGGAALVLVSLLLVAAATTVPGLRQVAGAAVVLALFVAVGRVLTLVQPDLRLVPYAAVVLVLAVAVRLVLAVAVRPLPARVKAEPWITGGRIGTLVAAGIVAAPAALVAIGTAGSTVDAAWRHELGPTAERVDWPLPVTLGLATVAAALLLPAALRLLALAVGAALGALLVPRFFPLAWWAPSIVDGLVAAPLAILSARTRRVSGGIALLLAAHAVAVGLGRSAVTAGVLAALLLLAAVTAWLARDPVVGRIATFIALAVPAGLGAALGMAAHREAVPFAAAGLVVSTAVLLVLRHRLTGGSLAIPGLAIPGTGLAVAVASLDGAEWYSAIPLLCAVLVGAVALPGQDAVALPGQDAVALPGQDAVALSGQGPESRAWYLVLSALTVVPPLLAVLRSAFGLLLAPYAWLSAVWSGRPVGVGLVPADRTDLVPGDTPFGFGPAAVTFALLALAIAVGHYGAQRSIAQAAAWAAGPAGLAVLAGTAALGAPWPTVAGLSLATGLAAALFAALRPAPVLILFAVPVAGAGLAGALPTKTTTLTGLGAVLVVATVCAVAGKGAGARVGGWLVAVPAAALLACTAARALDVTPYWTAFWLLAAAAVALGVSGVLRATAERQAVEAAAHASATAALLLTAGRAGYAAAVLGLWGIAVGLRAQVGGGPAVNSGPAVNGGSVAARRGRIVAGVGCELVAYWLLLWTGGVRWTEAYTLPAAGVALLAGWLAARTRPELHSWTAYGPALLAGFGPSLALVLTVPGEPVRRLALGVAGIVVVVGGAVRRRQAAVVVGGAALVLLALHETVLVWDLVPRWIPLGIGGLILVGLAITYERRRRDLRRLRTAVGGMR